MESKSGSSAAGDVEGIREIRAAEPSYSDSGDECAAAREPIYGTADVRAFWSELSADVRGVAPEGLLGRSDRVNARRLGAGPR